VRRFLGDPKCSSPEALLEAGPLAQHLGSWVKAVHALRVSQQAACAWPAQICRRAAALFASNPDHVHRWQRLSIAAVEDADAEDGDGGRVTHLALRHDALGMAETVLPLLKRGADSRHRDAAGVSVFELLQSRAAAVLSTLPRGVIDNEETPACEEGSASAMQQACKAMVAPHEALLLSGCEQGSAGNAISLAEAVAEVERLSLQQRLRDEAKAQCTLVEALEDELRAHMHSVEVLKQELEEDLVKVLPALTRAADSLECLSIADLHETRSMVRPPHGLALALAAVCTALGVERRLQVPRETASESTEDEDPWGYGNCMEYWPAARKLLAAGALIHQMKDFDKEALSSSTAERLRTVETHRLFDAQAARRISLTAEALILWLHAVLSYYDVSLVVAPKKERLRSLSKQVDASDRLLAKELQRLRALRLRTQEMSADLFIDEQSLSGSGHLDDVHTLIDREQQHGHGDSESELQP